MTRTVNPDFFTYLSSRKKCSENTRLAYTRNINNFLSFVDKPEEDVTSIDILNWIDSFPSDYSSATVAQKIKSVKSYYKFLTMFDIVEKNPTLKIESPTVKNKPKHYMSADMVKDMLRSCRNSRDKAIIITYATTGMRVSELTSLTIDQYQEMKENHDNMIKIVGKGNKERFVVLNDEVQNLIDNYLHVRGNNGAHCNNLFLSSEGNPIARGNLNNTLKAIAKRAGIPFWNEICNHQMRSACASIYSEAGTPVAVIRDMLGHASIETTSRYIKTNTEQVRKASMSMSFC